MSENQKGRLMGRSKTQLPDGEEWHITGALEFPRRVIQMTGRTMAISIPAVVVRTFQIGKLDRVVTRFHVDGEALVMTTVFQRKDETP